MSPTILLVENDDEFRCALGGLLRTRGYRIVEAVNGEEGILAAFEHRPDLVLLDLFLPILDGIRVAEAIRGDVRTCEVPMVAMSGTERSRLLASDLAHFVGFLAKPFSLTDLLETVERHAGSLAAST
jgi:two-component system, cell cycle response regulator DivK